MIKFTSKQIEILSVIRTGTEDGPCSVYDILERIPYPCKRDAMLHSIKILVDNGFVERLGRHKKAGRSVQVFGVTEKALEFI